MDKTQSKQDISSLVAKYQRLADTGKLKEFNEAQTVNEFILPMFQFLGWDIHNIHADEVTPEERISKGRVDWAFRIDGIPKFFLEAKALKVDLDVGKWAEQAINYSWNKGCTWAVLTDFEAIKVFNADVSTKNLKESLFFEIPVNEYLSQFDLLCLLSKESFKQGLLDKEAEKWGKKVKRTPVGDMLFQDLTEWRNLLTKYVHSQNKLEHEELDEGVQRIIDRLVFIRVTEDRGIEPNILLSALRTCSEGRSLAKILAQIFCNFDEGYNSKLFTPHASENWHIDNEPLEMVINGLYETKDGYRYDFSAISSDVLGGIYEQYLGHILRQAKKRASVKKEHKKRKEHGIYYTPTFIVKYIVKNTLGRMLEETPLNKAMNIRILDPACGSGSFLVEALDVMDSYLETQRKQKTKVVQMEFDFFRKVEILSRNIYGVDLDPQAVEICQLNLLLRTLKRRAILPNLTENITCGNSLISGAPLELIKYFDNPDEKRCLNWDKAFPDVMKNGGFDVVIGNPPYVRQEEIKEYKEIFAKLFTNVACGTADLYVYFFERAMQILKKGGYFGFIVSNKFVRAGYGKNLRRFLQDNFTITHFIDKFDVKVFEDATVDPCVIILKSERPKKSHKIIYNDKEHILQSNLTDKGWNFVSSNLFDLKSKIERAGIKIKDWKDVSVLRGIVTGLNDAFMINEEKKNKFICKDERSKEFIRPLLRGRDIEKWKTTFNNLYLLKITPGLKIEHCKPVYEHILQFKNQLAQRWEPKHGKIKWYELRPCVYYDKFEKPKIIYPDISENGGFYWDDEGYFFNNTVYMIVGNIKKSWLAILNSKLMSWYYKQIASGLGDKGVRYFTQFMKELPIANNTDFLEPLADKMLNLNKELTKTPENTDKWHSLKKEIEQTDRLIDEKVYELYRLTEKEIAIIENK